MRDADNDNDPLPFITLAAVTARVISNLHEKQDKQGNGEADADRRDEQKRKANSDYIAKRVRDIAAFERRARGD